MPVAARMSAGPACGNGSCRTASAATPGTPAATAAANNGPPHHRGRRPADPDILYRGGERVPARRDLLTPSAFGRPVGGPSEPDQRVGSPGGHGPHLAPCPPSQHGFEIDRLGIHTPPAWHRH